MNELKVNSFFPVEIWHFSQAHISVIIDLNIHCIEQKTLLTIVILHTFMRSLPSHDISRFDSTTSNSFGIIEIQVENIFLSLFNKFKNIFYTEVESFLLLLKPDCFAQRTVLSYSLINFFSRIENKLFSDSHTIFFTGIVLFNTDFDYLPNYKQLLHASCILKKIKRDKRCCQNTTYDSDKYSQEET